MEQLKRIGTACRQHYEKLILSLVLLLLAVGVWYLYQASQEEKEKVRQVPLGFERKSVKGVAPVNLASHGAVVREGTNPPALNLAGKHNLFNPVKWQQARQGGQIIKIVSGTEVGPEAMRIVRVRPLQLILAYERAASSGSGADAVVTGYHTVVTNELIANPVRRRIAQYLTIGDTNKQVFVLTEVKGPPLEPTELVAQLKDFGNEKVSFAPGKPYSRVVGHEAELKYPPSGKTHPPLRAGSPLDIEGEPYKIVDITPSKVVLSDDSNGKRYTIAEFVAP
jgi:hypothetical protein